MPLRSGQRETTTLPESPGAGERETPSPGLRHPVAFLLAHDPGLVSVKRSVLAAVVVPSIFAIARAITSNAQVPLFASFGADYLKYDNCNNEKRPALERYSSFGSLKRFVNSARRL